MTNERMRCTAAVSLLLLTFGELGGCSRPVAHERAGAPARSESAVSGPASRPAARVTDSDSPDPNRVSVSIEQLENLASETTADRWLRVVKLADKASGGWATGAFTPANRITIETRSVLEFSMDLSRIPINWNRRVVLRIDGHTSELTRAHYPVIRLRRSPTGGWNVVDDSDAGQ